MISTFRGYTIAGSGTFWTISKDSVYLYRVFSSEDCFSVIEQILSGNTNRENN